MDDREAFAAMIYVLRTGIPLGGAVGGPTPHDSRLLVATLEGLVVARPASEAEEDSLRSSTCVWTRRTTRRRFATS
jgi:hypothetical protein